MSAPGTRQAPPTGWLSRHVPITSWAPNYERRWLRPDLIAGLTVAALVVPKNLGYAEIAGVPIENGLYAVAASTILYALFGTSRQLSTGPSAALAALAGSAVLLSGLPTGTEATPLVAAIALAAGALFLVMSLLRMGWISQFLSRAVITGFLCGAAVDVIVGELPKLTGTTGGGDNVWREFGSWVRTIPDAETATLIVGLTSLASLLVLKRVAPAVPGALVIVVGGLVASAALDLGAMGVALVGEVPRGLPTPSVPDLELVWANLTIIAVAAFGIVAIGFSQTAGDARHFATKHRYRIDIDQETVAQGMANLGAGLFQGIPVSTSLSASSLNDSAGARTALASLATGGVVVLTLIAFAPLFSDLPKAVLAAVIIDAVVGGMIDVPELRRLYRVKPFDFWIAVAAIVGVLTFGVLGGIIVGVILSLIWLVYINATPEMPVLGRAPGSHVWRELDAHPDDERVPGILAIRLDGGLSFVTADALGDRIREIAVAADPPVRAVVLDCQGIDFIDSQGSAKLREFVELARLNQVVFRLARVKPSVMEILARDGVVAELGSDRIHADVHEAVTAQLGSDRAADAGTPQGHPPSALGR
ncbi:MAG: sulfate permease [Candidatus Limnocylindrales bacterium]